MPSRPRLDSRMRRLRVPDLGRLDFIELVAGDVRLARTKERRGKARKIARESFTARYRGYRVVIITRRSLRLLTLPEDEKRRVSEAH